MPHRRRSPVTRAATALAVGGALVLTSVPVAAAYHEPEAYFTLRDPEIKESSGIAASARADDLSSHTTTAVTPRASSPSTTTGAHRGSSTSRIPASSPTTGRT